MRVGELMEAAAPPPPPQCSSWLKSAVCKVQFLIKFLGFSKSIYLKGSLVMRNYVYFTFKIQIPTYINNYLICEREK